MRKTPLGNAITFPPRILSEERSLDNLYSYLACDVLHRQPPAVQDLLLQTSVLRELEADACAAVTRVDCHPCFPSCATATYFWLRSAMSTIASTISSALSCAPKRKRAIPRARACGIGPPPLPALPNSAFHSGPYMLNSPYQPLRDEVIVFDIAYVGHFTKDTVINPQGSTVHLGGAFYYGASVAARMGLSTAVITRLAQQDWAVVDELIKLGVTMFAKVTPESSNLRIVYPTENLDERTIYGIGYAGAFTVAEVAPVDARTFHIGASVRGEVPIDVIRALAHKDTRVSLDVQGFIRVNMDGKLGYAPWTEMPQVLKYVNVLKADATEAEFLTDTRDMRKAMQMLAEYGPQEVVLTQNSGVTVLAEGKFYEAPFSPRELRGRTGRGDTCTSAYLCKRLSAGPEQATRFAAAVTTLKLESPGPFRGPIPE